MGADDEIENQIRAIHITLRTHQAAMNQDMSHALQMVRNHVMYVHLRIEQTLQLLLAANIFGKELIEKNVVEIARDFNKIYPVFDQMEFHAKMNAAISLGLLPSNNKGSITSIMWEINDYRKYFSHPASHGGKLKQYEDKSKQLEILTKLRLAIYEIDGLILEKNLFFK